MTVQELREKLARHPAWLDVTIVSPDGHHHDISEVALGSDDEGDQVVAIDFTE